MTKTEFIRWFRSLKNHALVSELKLSEVYDSISDELYPSFYEKGFEDGKEIFGGRCDDQD